MESPVMSPASPGTGSTPPGQAAVSELCVPSPWPSAASHPHPPHHSVPVPATPAKKDYKWDLPATEKTKVVKAVLLRHGQVTIKWNERGTEDMTILRNKMMAAVDTSPPHCPWVEPIVKEVRTKIPNMFSWSCPSSTSSSLQVWAQGPNTSLPPFLNK